MLRSFFASPTSSLLTPAPWPTLSPVVHPQKLRNAFSKRAIGKFPAGNRYHEQRATSIDAPLRHCDLKSVQAPTIGIVQLSQKALEGGSIASLLDFAIEMIQRAFPSSNCAIWEMKHPDFAVSITTSDALVAQLRQSLNGLPLNDENQKIVRLSAPLQERTQATPITDASSNQPCQYYACKIPLNSGQVYGLIEIQLESPQILNPEQRFLLEEMAQVLGQAIQRQQQDYLLEVRSEILEKIAANASLADIFQALCKVIEAQQLGTRCSIIQLDEAAQQVMLEVAPNLQPHATTPDPYDIDQLPDLYQQVHQHGTTGSWSTAAANTVDDEDEAWHAYSTENQFQSLWVIPFGHPGSKATIDGFFSIASYRSDHRDPTSAPLVQTILQLATIATQHSRNTHKLEKQAMYDGLTGLPNRIFFMQQLSEQLQARQAPFALLFLDVDHFKLVNDSMGHNAGDELLVEITRRLIPCIRRTDVFARLGGDEFAIMLNGVPSASQAQSIADQIKAVLSLPFKILDREVFASVSIGIAHSDNYYASPAEILRDADIAMYRAKSLGRSRAATFDKTMHANVLDRMQIEMEMRRVVDQLFLDGSSQLQLYYQPIVSLKTGRVAGFEALIRWIHPERGVISPLEFIPIAEEIGLIIPIGQWVIQEACQQLSRWQTELNIPDLSMSINVSSRQFLQADFLPMVQQILEYTGISPDCLKIEITESVLMETASTVLERLEFLRDLGVRLSLDDFGTGYSSLSYLQQFPINTLKVDRSFVNKLAKDQDQVVQAIVALTDGLAMDAVAEGIETKEQLAHLRFLGCEYGQGYFFSPPMCREQAEKMLVDEPHWPDPLNILTGNQLQNNHSSAIDAP